ncbi:MAG TPA: S8 family serine peptidase, partial [Trebonia sp.]
AGLPLHVRKAAGIRAGAVSVLGQIGVPAAWSATRGAGVLVAVLDTGVAAGAPDLAGTVTAGPDFIAGTEPERYRPPHSHGTYIASLIAAHGSDKKSAAGVIGVAPAARILSLRVIPDDGEPSRAAVPGSALTRAIYYAVAHRAGVIVLPLGTRRPDGGQHAAVGYAISRGVVVVAPAGDAGTARAAFAPYEYPAAFPGVIAVAAVAPAGTRAPFSSPNQSVVVAAPGEGVSGAGPGGEYLQGDGTPQAAALVAGVAALIRARYPALSPALVGQALVASAQHRPPDGYDTATGSGEVDAAAALAAAAKLADTTPAPVQSPGQRFNAGAAALRAAALPAHRPSASAWEALLGVCALVFLVAAGLGGLLGLRSLRERR